MVGEDTGAAPRNILGGRDQLDPTLRSQLPESVHVGTPVGRAQLLQVALAELLPALRLVAVPTTQLGRRSDILHPLGQPERLLANAARPKPVNEHPSGGDCARGRAHYVICAPDRYQGSQAKQLKGFEPATTRASDYCGLRRPQAAAASPAARGPQAAGYNAEAVTTETQTIVAAEVAPDGLDFAQHQG
jgi:hypothetical protein